MSYNDKKARENEEKENDSKIKELEKCIDKQGKEIRKLKKKQAIQNLTYVSDAFSYEPSQNSKIF